MTVGEREHYSHVAVSSRVCSCSPFPAPFLTNDWWLIDFLRAEFRNLLLIVSAAHSIILCCLRISHSGLSLNSDSLTLYLPKSFKTFRQLLTSVLVNALQGKQQIDPWSSWEEGLFLHDGDGKKNMFSPHLIPRGILLFSHFHF